MSEPCYYSDDPNDLYVRPPGPPEESPCRYEPVRGDPAITVCVTHRPDYGLYGDEWCPWERPPEAP